MAKKFAELKARMTPEAHADAEQIFQQHLKEMPLHELRKAQQLSQASLAKALNINQAAVSKMERRTDMYISTLRDYIRAMGASWKSSPLFRMARSKLTTLPVEVAGLFARFRLFQLS